MYNSMSQLPSIPYNILVYLATQPSAENLWKMLKYKDYDCLNHDNVPFAEKMELIWKTGVQQKYGVFLTPLIEDAIAESKCIMKIYDYYIHNNEPFYSSVVYAFDFLYGGNMSLIDYNGVPASRGDVFIHTVLDTLNGAEVGGVGKMSFVSDLSRYSLAKATIGDSRKFTGVQIFLSTSVGDAGRQSVCDD